MPLELGVRLFASVREAVGADSVTVELTEGAQVSQLIEALAARYPAIARQERALSVAVNQEIAPRERVLSQGDEVALIPPVGGG